MEPLQVAQFLETLRARKLDAASLHLMGQLWVQVEKNVPMNERFKGPKSYGPALNLTVTVLEHRTEAMTTEEWNSLGAPLSILIGVLLKLISLNREAIDTKEKVETLMKVATIFLAPCQKSEILKRAMARTNGLKVLTLICWEELDLCVRKQIFGPFRDALLSTTARLHSRSSECQVLIERLVDMFVGTADVDFQEYIIETLVRFALARKDWQNELGSFFRSIPEIGAASNVINPKQFDATRREFLIRANKCLPPTRRVFSLECVEANADGIPLQKPEDFSNLWLDLSPLTGHIHLTFACESGSLVKIILDRDMVASILTSNRTSADEIEVKFLVKAPGIFIPFEPDTLHVSTLTAILKHDEQFTEAEANFFFHIHADKYKFAKSDDPHAHASSQEEDSGRIEIDGEVEDGGLEQSLILRYSNQKSPPITESHPETDRVFSPILMSNDIERFVEGSSSKGSSSCLGITPETVLPLSLEPVIDLTKEDPVLNIPVEKVDDACFQSMPENSVIESTTEIDFETELPIPQSHHSQAVESAVGSAEAKPAAISCDAVDIEATGSSIVDSSSDVLPGCEVLEVETAHVVGEDYQKMQSSSQINIDVLGNSSKLPNDDVSKCLDNKPKIVDVVFGANKSLPSFEELSQKFQQPPLLRPPTFLVPDAAELPNRRKDTSHSESERSACSSFVSSKLFTTTTTVKIKPPGFDLSKDGCLGKSVCPPDETDIYNFVDENNEQPAGLRKRVGPPKKPMKRMLYTPGKGDMHDDGSLKSDQSVDNRTSQDQLTDVQKEVFAKPFDASRLFGDNNKNNAEVGGKRKSSSPVGCLSPVKQRQTCDMVLKKSSLSIPKTGSSVESTSLGTRSPVSRRAKGDGVFTRGQKKNAQNSSFFSDKTKESFLSLDTPKIKRKGFIRGKGRKPSAKKVDPLRSEGPECSPDVCLTEPEVISTDNLILPPPISPPTYNLDLVTSSPPPPVEPIDEFEGSSLQAMKCEMKPNGYKKAAHPEKVKNEFESCQNSPKDNSSTQPIKEQADSSKGAAPTSSRLGSLNVSPVRSKNQLGKRMSPSDQQSTDSSGSSPSRVTRRSLRLNQSQTRVRARPRGRKTQRNMKSMSPSNHQNAARASPPSCVTTRSKKRNQSQQNGYAQPGCGKDPQTKRKRSLHKKKTAESDASPSYVSTRRRRLNSFQTQEPAALDQEANQQMEVENPSHLQNGAASDALLAMKQYSQMLNHYRSLPTNVPGRGHASNPLNGVLNNLQDVPFGNSIGPFPEYNQPLPPQSNPSFSYANSAIEIAKSSSSTSIMPTPGVPRNTRVFSPHFLRLGGPTPELLCERTRRINDLTNNISDVFINEIRLREANSLEQIDLTLDSMRTNLHTLCTKHIEWSKTVSFCNDAIRAKHDELTRTINQCTSEIQRAGDDMSVSFEVAIQMIDVIDEVHRKGLRSSGLRQNDPRSYSRFRQQVLQILRGSSP